MGPFRSSTLSGARFTEDTLVALEGDNSVSLLYFEKNAVITMLPTKYRKMMCDGKFSLAPSPLAVYSAKVGRNIKKRNYFRLRHRRAEKWSMF